MPYVSIPVTETELTSEMLGELLIEEWFKRNEIKVLAHHFELPYLEASAQYIVTRNMEKLLNFRTMKRKCDEAWGKLSSYSRRLLIESKNKSYGGVSYEELRRMREKAVKDHGGTSYFEGDEGDVNVYDVRMLYNFLHEYIKKQLVTVEVVTSTDSKFPPIAKNRLAYDAWRSEYYRHTIRVRLEPPYDGRYACILHSGDVERLLEDPKLDEK